jgi:hypothetical protein
VSYDTILAKSPSIIFRPGAASSAISVATWAEVQAFVALRQGAVIVYVDDGIAAAHVPAASGVTDFQGRGEIRAYRQDGSNYSTLIVDDGATLKSIYRIAGTVEVLGDTQGATPAFDFDYTPNIVGTPDPEMWMEEGGFIGTTPTCTASPIVVPNGQTLVLNFTNRGGIFQQSATFVITLAGVSFLTVTALSAAIMCFGSASGNFVTGGAGSVTSFEFDSNTLHPELSPVPAVFGGAASVVRIQLDTHEVELTFLATTANVLGTLQTDTLLPSTGTLQMRLEGFGGSGGGGGGGGGDPAGSPAGGGGGSGGCQYQRVSFDFDLSHTLDITIGAAGVGGPGGVAPGGAGTPGTNGLPSFALDATTNVALGMLAGSSGGGSPPVGPPNGGQGGATYPGALIARTAGDIPTAGQGFLASGGAGNIPGQTGASGQNSLVSLNVPGARAAAGAGWEGGAGGSGIAGGGGGGGGGAGPFADGGVGGDATATVGNPGVSPAANTGAGAGGGAGGNTSDGGAGANGSTGFAKLTFIAP